MLTASCHCGAVTIELSHAPESLTECNCSICRRYGARWAYYTRETARVHCAANAPATYRWNDRVIDFCHCTTCGCLTHYEDVEEGPGGRVAVNARMLPTAVTEIIPLRYFDGAASWEYLDD
jgi:hypothetical protein